MDRDGCRPAASSRPVPSPDCHDPRAPPLQLQVQLPCHNLQLASRLQLPAVGRLRSRRLNRIPPRPPPDPLPPPLHLRANSLPRPPESAPTLLRNALSRRRFLCISHPRLSES
ncbi:unnamed protein product [Urochloa humidicola]